jgi:hypothetical protein
MSPAGLGRFTCRALVSTPDRRNRSHQMRKKRSDYLCEAEWCHRAYQQRGPKSGRRLCSGHFKREVGLVPADKPIESRVRNRDRKCKAAQCTKPALASGMCQGHYRRFYLGYEDWAAPLREKRKEAMPHGFMIRLPQSALDALKTRSERTGVPLARLCRAIIERWVMTDGARKAGDLQYDTVAWRHEGSTWDEA